VKKTGEKCIRKKIETRKTKKIKIIFKNVLTLWVNSCIIFYVGSPRSDTTKIWLFGQAVKTPPFHGGNRGSIPLRVTINVGA
jgi:hypothetical protein